MLTLREGKSPEVSVGGRAFQAEGIANAKALGQHPDWFIQRPAGRASRVSKGEMRSERKLSWRLYKPMEEPWTFTPSKVGSHWRVLNTC